MTESYSAWFEAIPSVCYLVTDAELTDAWQGHLEGCGVALVRAAPDSKASS